MIVRVNENAPGSLCELLIQTATDLGIESRSVQFGDGSVVLGFEGQFDTPVLERTEVDLVLANHRSYMFATREHRTNSIVAVGTVTFGSGTPVLIAGPCVVESREQLLEAALAVKQAGATMLRGGAFKPRTSPYSFQGLGERGLQLLADIREQTGMPVVTEVLEPEQVEVVASHADMLQIGSRNMANTPLLKKAGRTGKPVLLKRGFSATVEEWLLSAEYVIAEGNPNVVLCERGIRGFDPAFRFNLDLNAVPLAKSLTHLPVIVDPSHGTGIRELVAPMAAAATAAGADGLIIESQPHPESAKCDAFQMISPEELAGISQQMHAIAVITNAKESCASQQLDIAELVA